MASDRSSLLRIDAPISVGELIDKITILELKGERIADRGKAANVAKELALLRGIKATAGLDRAEIDGFTRELKTVNAALWEIEDEIRREAAHFCVGQCVALDVQHRRRKGSAHHGGAQVVHVDKAVDVAVRVHAGPSSTQLVQRVRSQTGES